MLVKLEPHRPVREYGTREECEKAVDAYLKMIVGPDSPMIKHHFHWVVLPTLDGENWTAIFFVMTLMVQTFLKRIRDDGWTAAGLADDRKIKGR